VNKLRPSLALESAADRAEVWLKRHGKRPRGILFAHQQATGSQLKQRCAPSIATRLKVVSAAALGVAAGARKLRESVRRRFLPPGIATLELETGRERPPPPPRELAPGSVAGSLTSCLLVSLATW
jgi:hypothetical protein